MMFANIFGGKVTRAASPAEGNTAFALDLYSRLKATPGNLFFSPYSISSCLAMTSAGARGDTEKQMNAVLHLGEGQKVHEGFRELQAQLLEAGKRQGIQLNIANSLWLQKSYDSRRAFLDLAQSNYGAKLTHADFVGHAEQARNEVNHWVAQETRDKIQNILGPGSVGPATRLVLANAIYFKGIWEKPFEKSSTGPQPFKLGGGNERQVPLMHHRDTVRYVEDADFQAVELPYSGGELATVVLLPKEVEGCGALENRLTPSFISQSLSQMKRRTVDLFIPRFKLESEFDLVSTLTKLGMLDAFGSGADFSGIDGSKQLFISGVFHKAWGEVNEEGTEAAAATAVAVAASAVMRPPPPPPVFRADHPFLFFIRDTRSGSILFLGRLSEPTA